MAKHDNASWAKPNGNGKHNYGGSGKPLKGRSANQKKDGCALLALGMVGAGALLVSGAVWGIVEGIQAVL